MRTSPRTPPERIAPEGSQRAVAALAEAKIDRNDHLPMFISNIQIMDSEQQRVFPFRINFCNFKELYDMLGESTSLPFDSLLVSFS